MDKKFNKSSPKEWILILIATFFMFATRFMPPPEGLSQSGFQVLGILIGGLILWLGVAVDWCSLYVLFALMTVPALTVNQVISASYGNSTAVFLVFCFMMSACLIKSGIAKRIAIWFLTNKLARKGPWWTIAMYFLATFVINSCLSASPGIMIFLPILTEMLQEIGYEKGKPKGLTIMMMMGTCIVAQAANAATPIGHAMSLQGMSTYASMTGSAIGFFEFVATLLPLGFLSAVLWFLIAKFIWRPDVSALANVDFDRLSKSTGTVTKKEKVSLFFYAACIILWILPGLTRYISPDVLAPIFKPIDQCFPPLVSLFLMNFIRDEEGEKVLDFKDAVKNVNWNMYMFIGSIMSLGAFLSNTDVGLSTWMSTALEPLVSGISPLVFFVIMVMFGVIFTQFVANAVVIAITFTIAMPLCMGVYAGQINTLAVGLLLTHVAQLAVATPPSTPTAAVAGESGWVELPVMFRWGMLYSVIIGALVCVLGIPLAEMVTSVVG